MVSTIKHMNDGTMYNKPMHKADYPKFFGCLALGLLGWFVIGIVVNK